MSGVLTVSARLRRSWLQARKAAAFALGRLRGMIVFRANCDRVGRHCAILGRSPRISNYGVMEVGSGFRIDARTTPVEITIEREGALVVGDDSRLNQGVQIYVRERLSIGNRVGIGSGTHILDTNSHPVRPGGMTKIAAVTIEDDVWVGMNVIILPGTHIGRGSVIGAGSIVSGLVPEGSIVRPTVATVASHFDVPRDFRRYARVRSLREIISATTSQGAE